MLVINATNFIFNGKSLSDFGYIICEFEGETNTSTPSSMVFKTINTPNSDRQKYLSAYYDGTIQFQFSICKFDCFDRVNELEIDQFEDAEIKKWLIRRDGYHDFMFEQDGFENIHYNAFINVEPQIIFGIIRGYKLTVITDNAYGYTDWITDTFTIDNSNPHSITLNSDEAGYIYPIWEIIPNVSSTGFALSVDTDTNNSYTTIKNVYKNVPIIIDSEKCIYDGLIENFNWVFPRLVQGYGETVNTISCSVSCTINMKFRLAKKGMC